VAIRKMADGEEWVMPPTIEDPTVLDQISGKLEELGYPEKATVRR
jgi:propionyl-CoA synthetase